MTDLTEFHQAARLTNLIAEHSEPGTPDLARENEELRAELLQLEVNLEDAQADAQSLRSLIGALVHFHLGDEVTLEPDELKAHPHSTFHLSSMAHTIDGQLILRTRA